MTATGVEFHATHRVPPTGLATFSAPDANAAPGLRLTAGLDVQVVEQHADGWAHVACSNGWRTWVDGRQLLDPRPTASTTVRTGDDELYRRLLPVAAAGLVLVGAVLPWFRTPAGSVSSWRVSLWSLVFRSRTTAQPHIGEAVLVAAVLIGLYVVVPLVSGRVVPRLVLLAGALLAVDISQYYFLRWMRSRSGIGLDLGPFLVLAGGIVACIALWRTRPAAVARMRRRY